LGQLSPKLIGINALGCPTILTNFKQIGEQVCRVFKCAKRWRNKKIKLAIKKAKRNKQNAKVCSLLS